jgi:hypothetical protein
VELRFIQDRGNELGERRPRVDGADKAVRELIRAKRTVDRLDPGQGRMIGRQPGDLVVEIDVVAAFVKERAILEQRPHLRKTARHRRRAQEPRQVEHAAVGHVGLAVRDQRLTPGALQVVEREAVEVEMLFHLSDFRSSRAKALNEIQPQDQLFFKR